VVGVAEKGGVWAEGGGEAETGDERRKEEWVWERTGQRRALDRGVVGKARIEWHKWIRGEREATGRARGTPSRSALRRTGEDLQPKSSCWRHESCPQRGNHVQTSPKTLSDCGSCG
jgi:hypothetical protein